MLRLIAAPCIGLIEASDSSTMAPPTTRCDDDLPFVLARLLPAVVSLAILACGGQVGSTTTDAGTSNKDATSKMDAGLDFDALSFDIYVPDVFEEAPVAQPDAGPCVPLDGSCATALQCCPLQHPQGFECIGCMGVCYVGNCHQ